MAAKADLLDFIIPMMAEADLEELSRKTMQELLSEVCSDPLGKWFLNQGRMQRQTNSAGAKVKEDAGVYTTVVEASQSVSHEDQYCIDLHQATVYSPQGSVFLTPAETRLLTCLARQPGVIVPHSILSDAISQDHTGAVWTDPKHHIRNLRIKLGDDPQHPHIIRSRRGMGYYLDKKIKGQVVW